MKDVLILARTHMQNLVCVGGILTSGEYVRLLDSKGYPQPPESDYAVGHVYAISFTRPQTLRPPHTEDVMVQRRVFKLKAASEEKIIHMLTRKLRVKIWEGSPGNLFDGTLNWTERGSGYLPPHGKMPASSVGFWKPDQPLTATRFGEKIRYTYPPHRKSFYSFGSSNPDEMLLKISYVGFEKPVAVIPAGTLVRVSLARWWAHDGHEERCYLQMSGWLGIGSG